MLRIAIVDDDKEDVQIIEDFLAHFFEESDMEYHTTHFSDGMFFIENYTPAYDIVFMDIDMRLLNGMKTAQRLRERDSNVILIFMTRMSQYAAYGYDVDAIGFLIKPVKYYGFKMKMKKALSMLEGKKDIRVLVSTKEDGQIVLSSREISYIEVLNHLVILHTGNGKEYRTWCSLKEYADKLSGNHFCACNRYCLVNLAYVTGVDAKGISLSSGIELQLSRGRRKEFMEALTSYLGEV
jgi:DNA-binding LytR/AlgR family response regulator